MNLFQRIANLFRGGGSGSDGRFLPIYVRSRRCNEPIAGQLDLLNELSLTDDEGDAAYYGRKVLHTSGERRCFDQVEVFLWFNNSKQLLRHEVQGGEWLEAEAYEQELARFHAPPAEEEATQADETQES
ncbi:MAG: hypothetical protein KDE19_06680 [Caldilineaceae bacterium]|nr:hypothetical protein [Caldilineaceae bacterium]